MHIYIYTHTHIHIYIYTHTHIYIYIYTHTHNILFIHSHVDGHLGCFHLLAIVYNAAMNIGVQVSVGVPAFSTFGYMPKSAVAGSYGNSMFHFLSN